jgi:hypothetical protein
MALWITDMYQPGQAYVAPPTVTPTAVPATTSSVPGTIDPTQTDPHAIASQLLQAQFNEWESTFKPIELAAMKELSWNDPTVLPTALGKARGAAEGSTTTMGGVLNRQLASQGIKQTPQQSAATKRILDLNRAQNIAGAENIARANVATQDLQLLYGQVPNYNIVRQAIGS